MGVLLILVPVVGVLGIIARRKARGGLVAPRTFEARPGHTPAVFPMYPGNAAAGSIRRRRRRRSSSSATAALSPAAATDRGLNRPLASITGVVGLNGSGKGLVAGEAAMSSWKRGRPVVSNLRLYPERAGFPATVEGPAGPVPLAIRIESWRDLFLYGVVRCDPGRNCDEHDVATSHPERSLTGGLPCLLWLDEINAVFPARQFASLPPELVRIINQLRKRSVNVVWTSPAWEQADAELRRVTRMLVVCRSSFDDPWRRVDERGWLPKVQRNEDGARILAGGDWPPRRLFRFDAFRAEDFEAFAGRQATDENGRPMQPRRLWRVRYWRQRHHAQFIYGTEDGVDSLDHLDYSGTCPNCDGTRRRHTCPGPGKCGTSRHGDTTGGAAASGAGGGARHSHAAAP